jgi:tetratricopeptide (TPR) repeat protein
VWKRDRRQPTLARVYVGDRESLELVSLHVTVTVEGPRARTVVDHVFRNPHDRRLEGTFEYPLPTGASASYFAMFLGQSRDAMPPRFGRADAPPLPEQALARLTPAELVKQVNTLDWGPLQEARVVNKQKALETYEEIVRGRIDPGLLEYAGGNTFRGRVFPIAPRGYNRILLAYEELLPSTQSGVQYRFPLPDRKLAELNFTLQANRADVQEAVFRPADAAKAEAGGRLTYTRTWKNDKPAGEVLFAFTPPRPQVQAVSGRQGESGPLYVYARIRPELKEEAAKPFAAHAVFLLDTSLSEHPDRFNVRMKLLRKILETDDAIKHFNILTFDVAGRWVEPKGWLANTEVGRKTAWDRLDGLVLEGATDVSAALDRLVSPGFEVAAGTPLNVFLLSDGQITWCESDVAALAARFEARCPFPTRFHCYHTGLGADNLELFEALTRRGGGVFNCFGDADLAAAAGAHRHQCLQVERVRFTGGPEVTDVLVAGRKAAVYPGGDLIVAAQASAAGRTQIVVEGTFLGNKVVQTYPVEIAEVGELAPRGWAEIAVASLLALNEPRYDGLVTAYCQQFGIGSRVASFLVLENDNDYKRFNLQQERGQVVPGGDLGEFLAKAWQGLGRLVGGRETFERFLARVDERVGLLKGQEGAHVKKLLELLGDKDFDLPDSPLGGELLHRGDVLPHYWMEREKNPREVSVYTAEARRRAGAKDLDGAVRVLSSVVEQYPGRADALRLVGYRLLDLGQPAQAVRLFRRVQNDRPFEAHSYRDLARGLEESGKFGLAAVQYEIILAGAWHNRFGQALKEVAREEYAQMMQTAVRRRAVGPKLLDHFGERLERMGPAQARSDLRVTISWNTDATDVDLWVIEPDGTKCFYSNARTKNGGQLSQDQTQGYGPERYHVAKAMPGVYTVVVHYFRPNANLLGGETHVNVVVTRQAGGPQEVSERHNVILRRADEQVQVCKVKF